MALATTRACDALLEFCVLSLAVWTLAYHACLVLGSRLGLGAGGARCRPRAVRGARRAARGGPDARPTRRGPVLPWRPRPRYHRGQGTPRRSRRQAALAFASGWPWPLVWAPWPVAAVAVLAGGARRPLVAIGDAARGAGAGAALAWSDGAGGARRCWWSSRLRRHLLPAPGRLDRRARALPARRHAALPRRPAGDVLAAAALLTRRCWGRSPARRASPPPALAHLVAAPFACALAVLALWRLLRAWQVRMVAPALTVALVFLLFAVEPAHHLDADVEHMPGRLLRLRAWQGKVILVAVLVPLLFALLHEHAARAHARRPLGPARRRGRGRGRAVDDGDVPRARRRAWLPRPGRGERRPQPGPGRSGHGVGLPGGGDGGGAAPRGQAADPAVGAGAPGGLRRHSCCPRSAAGCARSWR